MPTFRCNYRCSYCYLGKRVENDSFLNLTVLDQRLSELSKEFSFDFVSIYGGEMGLFSEKYVSELCKIISHYCDHYGFSTNFSRKWFNDYCQKNCLPLLISLNKERPNYESTLSRLKKYHHTNATLGVVVLPSVLNENVESLFDFYNDLGYNVYFFQYHPNQNSKVNFNLTQRDYTEFLQRFIEKYKQSEPTFELVNLKELENPNYNPKDSGFIYIFPNGKFGSTEYNNGVERFVEFSNLNQWKVWAKKRDIQYFLSCNLCEYYGKCKAEHIVTTERPWCSGLYTLLAQNKNE